MLFSWKGGIRLIDEDVSRRTIAVSIKATKLTGRVLAQACLAVGRKIKKAHRARQTPHGKQTVRQLMGHGAATNSIEVESPKDFDRVARRWNVDYAFYKTGPDKYLLFLKILFDEDISGYNIVPGMSVVPKVRIKDGRKEN